MKRLLFFIAMLTVSTVTIVAAEEPSKFSAEQVEFFEKKIRPILVNRCFECHGDQDKPKGGLRLDSREATLDGGETGPAVVPGKSKDSLLISAINYGDVYQMPPKSKMPADEIALLTKWVEMGAPWPPSTTKKPRIENGIDVAARKAAHWCWKSPQAPTAPVVKNAAWATSDVDRFLLAKLEQKGLQPSPRADKRTLIRRAYFATIGLPPTPEEVAAFVNDESPDAFEKVIDRLLNSVHFGERWARHWLDLVRYAETRGHEFEPIIPNAWQYRDYVIRALNADVPYDRFVVEHVAGDIVSAPRLSASGANESVLGTGFWFLGEEVHSPVDIRQDETDRIDNRLDVFSKTFLGLTLSCARCHDHKFDALTQRDYYGLAGFVLGGSYRQVAFESLEHNRRIVKELEELRRKSRTELVQSLLQERMPVVDRLAEYLSTAAKITDAGIGFEKTADSLVFADFEGDSYGDWKSEGDAFGTKPPRKSDNEYAAPLEGFVGQRLVNSHRNALNGPNNAGTRDAQTGKLTSPTFRIAHDRITFLIAGGSHAEQTCMNLVVDGKVVRTGTGQNSGQLKPVEWDVKEWRGKEAVLVIVDTHRGGWGHVIVDHIEFKNGNNSDARARAEELDAPTRSLVATRAGEKQLDVTLLARWVIEVADAKKDPKSILAPVFETRSVDVKNKPTAATVAPIAAEKIIADFTQRNAAWFVDGVAFGERPTQIGDLKFGTTVRQPIVGLHVVAAATRDPLLSELHTKGDRDHGTLGGWDRSGKTIRTPEVTLTEPRLWYLVRGSGRAYATVNSHLVIAGPLHGGILMEWQGKADEWKWVSHNLPSYKGNRLHVEFTPRGTDDCAIAMVVQSDSQPPLPAMFASNGELTEVLKDESKTSSNNTENPVAESARRLQHATMASILQLKDGMLTDPARVRLVNWFLQNEALFVVHHQPNPVAEKFIAAQAALIQQLKKDSQLAPAMLDGNGVDEFVLVRGNSKTPGKNVPRRFLEAITGTESNYGPGSGRLKLAEQMIDPKNPLTARVAVNRIWHHLFGRGLVPTVDNFGVLGEAPSHPELLDQLTLKFVSDGWSQKRLIKQLMLTNAYQQQSTIGGPAEQIDPDNRLLHRMPIKRLEGEVIRDAVLTVSGRLDRTTFGQSVPIHLTAFMEGRGRPGVNGPLDGAGRRSIYIAVRRNFLSPMMLTFDTPNPFSTVGRRTVSNVPAQALILMNDPFIIEQSKLWAQRVLAEPNNSDEDRIRRLYETALSRQPSAEELSAAVLFLDDQSERLGLPVAGKSKPVELWADLCHVIFNTKEFIFVN